jgi:hypothetical protein
MKYLSMNSELIEAFKTKILEDLKTQTGCILNKDTFSFSFPTKPVLKKEDRPYVFITRVAYAKMYSLVDKCLKEIAWLGTVTHEPGTKDFVIEDIFVFPQEVTNGTAESTDDYGLWLAQFDNETFNKLRMHGHSHVWMDTSPSLIDTNYQERIARETNDFYLFMIMNKRNKFTMFIYDKVENVVYDLADIDVDFEIVPEDIWATRQIETYVTEPKPTTTDTTKADEKKITQTDTTPTRKRGRRKKSETSVYDDYQKEVVNRMTRRERKRELLGCVIPCSQCDEFYYGQCIADVDY